MVIRERKADKFRGGKNNRYGFWLEKRFKEIQKEYDQAVFIGLVRPSIPDQKAIEMGLGLCPDPDIMVKPGDLLIFIASTSSPTRSLEAKRSYESDLELARSMKAAVPKGDSRKTLLKNDENVLICGWRSIWSEKPSRLIDRIKELAKFRRDGTYITFINQTAASDSEDSFEKLLGTGGIHKYSGLDEHPLYKVWETHREVTEEYPSTLYKLSGSGELSNVFIRHVHGDAADVECLAPVLKYCNYGVAIVLGTQSSIDLSPSLRDSRVLCIMLALRKLCRLGLNQGKPMHVVGENEEDVTGRLALSPPAQGRDLEPDFINGQAINARVITHCLAYPLITPCFFDIFDDKKGSCDLELIKATDYVPIRTKMRYGVVMHLVNGVDDFGCKDERAVCIGFQDSRGKVTILPQKSMEVEFDDGHSLIVFRRILPLHTYVYDK